MPEETLAQLAARLDTLDVLLRGDGNGSPGLAARVRALEYERKEIRTVVREWNDMKARLSGVRSTLIVVTIVLTALGGGMGLAILDALAKIARELP